MASDAQHHWQTLAVNQRPAAGTDYPFADPSDDVRYLLGDLWLSYEDDACAFQLPLQVLRLWNFGTAGEARRDLLIADAAGATVFDSREADTYSDTAWGERLRTLSWSDGRSALRCTMRTGGPPWDPARTWADDITAVRGQLDPRACQRLPRRLRSLWLGLQQLTGTPEMVEGYNLRLRVEPVIDADGGRRLTRIRLRALPGDGLGRLPGCGDGEPVLRRINTVQPTTAGDFTLDAAGCYWLQRPGVIGDNGGRALTLGGAAFAANLTETINAVPAACLAGETVEDKQATRDGYLTDPATTARSALQLNNDCGPCCTCDDFLGTYEGIRRLFFKYQKLGGGAEQVRDQLAANLARWEAQRLCRLFQSLRLVLRAESQGTLYVSGLHCNNTACCAMPLTLRTTFEYYRDGVAIGSAPPQVLCSESFRTGTDTRYDEARYQPLVDWPVMDHGFDLADPQTTSRFRNRLKFPTPQATDAVRVTFSVHSPAIYDASGRACELPEPGAVPVPAEVAAIWADHPPSLPVRGVLTKTIAFSPDDGVVGSGRGCS